MTCPLPESQTFSSRRPVVGGVVGGLVGTLC